MNNSDRKRKTLMQMKIDRALGSLKKNKKYIAPFIINTIIEKEESGLDFKIL